MSKHDRPVGDVMYGSLKVDPEVQAVSALCDRANDHPSDMQKEGACSAKPAFAACADPS